MVTHTHTCHVRGCTMVVPPRLLMCKRHWMMCPAHLRSAVWEHYRPGQEEDKRVTMDYARAAVAACDAVAEKEKAEKDQPRLL